MISIDANETVALIDDWFNQSHKQMLDALILDLPEKLAYLVAFLKVKEKVI